MADVPVQLLINRPKPYSTYKNSNSSEGGKMKSFLKLPITHLNNNLREVKNQGLFSTVETMLIMDNYGYLAKIVTTNLAKNCKWRILVIPL